MNLKKYKSKKDTKNILISLIGSKNKPSSYDKTKFRAIENGTFILEIWFLNLVIFYI